MSNNANVKEEPPIDMEDDKLEAGPPAFAAALGLHRVGSVLPPKPQPQQPIQVLNARGMPARIRKKNKLFFDDNIVNERPHRTSPLKKQLKPSTPSPQKSPSKILKKRKGVVSRYMKIKEDAKMQAEENVTIAAPEPDLDQSVSSSNKDLSLVEVNESNMKIDSESINRKIFQRIGLRLRNLLKLPKAHKWVSYEWFYSYIDKPLFDGDNDFQVCLKESFPQLITRQLTRVEWSKIRKLMGKPRRCSQEFFAEERAELERRRNKIRMLQSRMCADAAYVKDLPSEIPLPLSVGTKVTARLRHPQDGIYTGSIAVVDTLSSSYRITFDRQGLGTHTVPDFEVLANEFNETVSVISLTMDLRPKTTQPMPGIRRGALLSTNRNDPLLGSEIYNNSKLKSIIYPKETIGGFQLKLLELVIRTKKTLAVKKMKLQRLNKMNGEAEVSKSFNQTLPEDYQRRYASIVIGMEKLNQDMQAYLNQIQNYTRDLTKEPIVAAMLAPSYLREKCKELAVETVKKNNQAIKDDNSMLRLITDLATILWVASNMSADDQNAYVMQVLEVCLEESKNRLDPENVESFQKNVHVHMRHIELDAKNMNSSAVK